jgi:large subunit ribosomal protein L29
MKPAKWRDLSDDEVEQKMRELGEEVFNLRFQLSMGVAKNPSRIRQAKRDLARAKTIVHERALERARAAAAAVTGSGAGATVASKRG